mgnify:CR=1 FL=1
MSLRSTLKTATPVASWSSTRAVRLNHARELGAHRLDLGAIDRDAGTAGGTGHVNDLEDTAATCCDGRQSAGISFAGCASPAQFRTGRLVEQFQPTRHGFGGIAGIHRIGVSRIHEDQFTGAVARPDGRGQGIEQRPHRLDVAQQLVVARGKIQQFLFDAAHVTQAQHGASGDGASFCFHRTPGARGQRHDKAAAISAQRVHRLLHPVCSHAARAKSRMQARVQGRRPARP